jgi:hypothetical protein
VFYCVQTYSRLQPLPHPIPLLKPFYSSERQNCGLWTVVVAGTKTSALSCSRNIHQCDLCKGLGEMFSAKQNTNAWHVRCANFLICHNNHEPVTRPTFISPRHEKCVFMFSCLVRYYCLYIPCGYSKSLFLCAYGKRVPNQEPLTLFVCLW